MKSIVLSVLALSVLAACNQPGKSPAQPTRSVAVTSVIQPMEGLEIPVRTFEVSTTEASVIELPNGGNIAFPANAFVDQSGHPVSGKVTVEWQEYHSLADIMVSGIPMEYDSAGVQHSFVSGGMFTIDAHQNGQEIELAKGKEAKVALATYDTQKQFNFYSLNEQTGDWSYRLTAEAEPNPDMVSSVPSETQPKKETSGKQIFLNVDAGFHKDSISSLNGKDLVGWNVKAADVPKNLQREIASMEWNAQIVGETPGGYVLELSNKKTKLRLNAQPVTMDDALSNTAAVEKRTEKRWSDLLAFQQQEKEAEMLRTASIPGFGTYNWDIIHMRESPIAFKLELNVPGKNMDVATIFHVCPEERAVIRYTQEDFDKFSFDPNKGNCIIAVFPDKSAYTVSDKQFDDARQAGGEREFTFDMKSRNERVTSGRQLGQLVNRLI